MFFQRATTTSRGFTLVEVMVTLFIIAIGVLGVSGLQLASMRSNHSAFLRSHATLAAYALVDRIRTDPASFVAISIDTDNPSGKASFKAWADELVLTPLLKAANQPLGALDCTNGNACNNGHCAITIRWNDARGESQDLKQSGRNAEAMELLLCARVPQ
jgi:type IV pilus assembly protein PilV